MIVYNTKEENSTPLPWFFLQNMSTQCLIQYGCFAPPKIGLSALGDGFKKNKQINNGDLKRNPTLISQGFGLGNAPISLCWWEGGGGCCLGLAGWSVCHGGFLPTMPDSCRVLACHKSLIAISFPVGVAGRGLLVMTHLLPSQGIAPILFEC